MPAISPSIEILIALLLPITVIGTSADWRAWYCVHLLGKLTVNSHFHLITYLQLLPCACVLLCVSNHKVCLQNGSGYWPFCLANWAWRWPRKIVQPTMILKIWWSLCTIQQTTSNAVQSFSIQIGFFHLRAVCSTPTTRANFKFICNQEKVGPKRPYMWKR